MKMRYPMLCGIALLVGGGTLQANQTGVQVRAHSGEVLLLVPGAEGQVISRLTGPEGSLASREGRFPSKSGRLKDGLYRYEVDILPPTRSRTAAEFESDQYAAVPQLGEQLSGSFKVLDGALVDEHATETPAVVVAPEKPRQLMQPRHPTWEYFR